MIADFYQVNLDYEMKLSGEAQPAQGAQETYQCVVALSPASPDSAAFIQLNFPEKQTFMLGKMRFMVLYTNHLACCRAIPTIIRRRPNPRQSVAIHAWAVRSGLAIGDRYIRIAVIRRCWCSHSRDPVALNSNV